MPGQVLTFLFGEPGWYWWYVALWLSLVPGIAVWRWLGTMTPGAGPQGGLVAFGGLFITLGALTLLGLGLAVLCARAGDSPGVGRYARVLGTWLIGWGLVAWKIAGTANRASLADASPAERRRARRTYLFLLLAAGAIALGVLARVRDAAG